MNGKLIKGLSGLGGASALTTGGVFLKNHLDGVNKRRSEEQLLQSSDVAAEVLESTDWGVEDNLKLLKSNSSDDLWEMNWIIEVLGDFNWAFKTFEKDEMKAQEKKYWEKLINVNNSGMLQIDQDKKNEINEDATKPEYWQKYRAACVIWNLKRKDLSMTYDLCTNSFEDDPLERKIEYKEYQKLKTEGKWSSSLREFYWTVWRKFKKEKDADLTNEKTDTEVLAIYEQWKASNSNLFPQSTPK